MSIAANLTPIRDQIAAACRRSGRSEASVSLMAVSKMHPVELILEAHAAGLRLFGENRVQEFQDKHPTVAQLPESSFHLIGPLQSNKSTRAVELFDAIDTVDSLKLAQRLETAAATQNKTLPLLVEVKLSHEASKHGISPEHLSPLLDALAELPHLEPQGLMTVPPWSLDAETARPYFQTLRRLRDQYQRLHPGLTQLSMGMSNDFTVAIEEGSNCIRLGTALFGKRQPQQPSA